MPRSMRKECSYPGCHVLVDHDQRRCSDHPLLDYHDPRSQRLYNTKRWKRLRSMQLAREPLCAECLKDGIYTQATEVDHLEPHRGDEVKFYGGALQSLCKFCHSKKTNMELRGGELKSLGEETDKRGRSASRKKLPDRKPAEEAGHA